MNGNLKDNNNRIFIIIIRITKKFIFDTNSLYYKIRNFSLTLQHFQVLKTLHCYRKAWYFTIKTISVQKSLYLTLD